MKFLLTLITFIVFSASSFAFPISEGLVLLPLRRAGVPQQGVHNAMVVLLPLVLRSLLQIIRRPSMSSM